MTHIGRFVTSLLFALSFIALPVLAQAPERPLIELGAPAATSTGTSSESTPETEEETGPTFRTEEVRGVVKSIDETFISIATDDEKVRKIRFGNRGSIAVMRDGEAAALQSVAVGDAVIVHYTSDAEFSGTVQSASTSTLAITTADGKDFTFTTGDHLRVRFFTQPGVRATAPGIAPVVSQIPAGTDVDVLLDGENIVLIEAYSSGNLPSQTGLMIPLLLVLILGIVGGLIYVKGKRGLYGIEK